MRERPILFSGPMVLAILDGRKTQTRRIVRAKSEPWRWHHLEAGASRGDYTPVCGDGEDPAMWWWTSGHQAQEPIGRCPYGLPGDRLWVREAFRLRADQDHKRPSDDYWKDGCWHEATGNGETPSGCGGGIGRLRPSIFMPRWASRIDLEITDLRVERLHAMSDEDAVAEGVSVPDLGDWAARGIYADLWNSINGAGAWDANPWVWVIAFRRVKP